MVGRSPTQKPWFLALCLPMWSGIVAPGDSVLGTDYSSRRILIEGADEAATHPKLFGRESSLCEDFPGLRSVRTSTRCSLDNANTDATKRYVQRLFGRIMASFFRLERATLRNQRHEWTNIVVRVRSSVKLEFLRSKIFL